MKSIVVKTKEGGMKIYCSPISSELVNFDTGERKKLTLTEEEQEQSCYQSLIKDIERQQFEKQLLSVLENHLGDLSDLLSVKIKIEYTTDRKTELNIINQKNYFNHYTQPAPTQL